MTNLLHPSTQILKRNLEHITGTVLAINPVELATVALLPKKNLTISCTDFGLFTQFKNDGYTAAFETHHVSKSTFDTVVIFLPKSDAEIEMTLAWASECISKNGQLILIGQNDAGIKSAKKTLEKFIGPIVFSDAARHSAFYVAHKTVKLKKFNLNDYWQSYSFVIPVSISESSSAGRPGSMHLNTGSQTARSRKADFVASGMTEGGLKVFSLPGTFSHGRLDEGTALLLERLEIPTDTKRILDWGCGSGTIGALLAAIHPSITVDMVDSNALAIESAQKTIAQNRLKTCTVFPSHIFSEVKETYDYIVANPPFHKGHDTNYGDSEQFLKEAKQHLLEHGHLVLVANAFLHYEQFLEQSFGYVKTLEKTNRYKVLEVVNVPQKQAGKGKKQRKTRPQSLDEFEDFR